MHCIFNVQLISNVKSQLPVIVCIKKNKKDPNTESTALSYVQCKCTSYKCSCTRDEIVGLSIPVHVHVYIFIYRTLDGLLHEIDIMICNLLKYFYVHISIYKIIQNVKFEIKNMDMYQLDVHILEIHFVLIKSKPNWPNVVNCFLRPTYFKLLSWCGDIMVHNIV